jgi:hypothetical protein
MGQPVTGHTDEVRAVAIANPLTGGYSTNAVYVAR